MTTAFHLPPDHIEKWAPLPFLLHLSAGIDVGWFPFFCPCCDFWRRAIDSPFFFPQLGGEAALSSTSGGEVFSYQNLARIRAEFCYLMLPFFSFFFPLLIESSRRRCAADGAAPLVSFFSLPITTRKNDKGRVFFSSSPPLLLARIIPIPPPPESEQPFPPSLPCTGSQQRVLLFSSITEAADVFRLVQAATLPDKPPVFPFPNRPSPSATFFFFFLFPPFSLLFQNIGMQTRDQSTWLLSFFFPFFRPPASLAHLISPFFPFPPSFPSCTIESE